MSCMFCRLLCLRDQNSSDYSRVLVVLNVFDSSSTRKNRVAMIDSGKNSDEAINIAAGF